MTVFIVERAQLHLHKVPNLNCYITSCTCALYATSITQWQHQLWHCTPWKEATLASLNACNGPTKYMVPLVEASIKRLHSTYPSRNLMSHYTHCWGNQAWKTITVMPAGVQLHTAFSTLSAQFSTLSYKSLAVQQLTLHKLRLTVNQLTANQIALQYKLMVYSTTIYSKLSCRTEPCLQYNSLQ